MKKIKSAHSEPWGRAHRKLTSLKEDFRAERLRFEDSRLKIFPEQPPRSLDVPIVCLRKIRR
jgi:hypothetical protein